MYEMRLTCYHSKVYVLNGEELSGITNLMGYPALLSVQFNVKSLFFTGRCLVALPNKPA